VAVVERFKLLPDAHLVAAYFDTAGAPGFITANIAFNTEVIVASLAGPAYLDN
jgi:hypothetical protein